MPGNQTVALKRRFGLAAPPIVFEPTRRVTVWGGMGSTGNGDVDQAEAEFIDWLAAAYPGLVEAMLEAVGAEAIVEAEGLGQTQEKGLISQLLDTAQQILPAYLQFEQQREVLDIQLERARAGLPPLNTGQYAPSVQVGLDQETIARIANEAAARASAGAGAVLQSPWVWAGVGGLALILLMNRKGGRRRRRS